MGDFVEGLGEIQQHCVHLSSPGKVVGDVVDGDEELGFTGAPFPEAVLSVAEDLVFVEMAHDAAVDDVFQDLARNGRERHRSVVRWEAAVTLLEDGDYVGLLPVGGNLSSVQGGLEQRSHHLQVKLFVQWH